MPLTGIEHQWSVGPSPNIVAKVQDKIVAIASNGMASVINPDIGSLTYNCYTPAQTIVAGVVGSKIYYTDTYLAAGGWRRYTLRWFDINGTYGTASGSDLIFSGYGSPWAGWLTGSDEWIIGDGARYNISNQTISNSGQLGNPGIAEGRYYVTSAANIWQINPSDGSIILGPIPLAAPGIGIGIYINGTLWWSSGTSGIALVGIEIATNTPRVVTATPSGYPTAPGNVYCQFEIGLDGYLYRLQDTNTLIILDPQTGRWSSEALPTVRNERYRVIPMTNKLWIPSGQPANWN